MEKVLSCIVLLALTGCGGGGGTFGEAEVVKRYPIDGSGVAVAENIKSSSGNYDATFLLSEVSGSSKIADALYRANNGLFEIADGDSYSDGTYEGVISGINPNGEEYSIAFYGIGFGEDGYVSYNIITVDGTNYLGIGTDGRTMQGMPNGSFSYDGSISILGGVSGEPIEDGSFRLVADFNSKTASMSGTTTTKFITADVLNISNAGEITGNAKLGIRSLNSLDASVNGYFAGQAAGGVHGAAYQTADVEDGMAAVFIGVR